MNTPARAVVGVDVGTSSTKAVLVDLTGRILRISVREHAVDRPRPGWVEMNPDLWWQAFVETTGQLMQDGDTTVVAVGVSGIGPCVLLTDEAEVPLRPAILYGVDTRSTSQITRLNELLGADQILSRCASALSTQAAGPKIAWIADNEPAVFAKARRLFMPSSWLVRGLTGCYVLDHHSASQCTPLYDATALQWYRPWVDLVAPQFELPPLRWPGEIAGTVSRSAAAETRLPTGIPVVTGTIDGWAEALSVDAHQVGDLMVMYGTTLFLIHTTVRPLTSARLWGTVGALPGTHNLAGGMATSGAITSWLRELFGSPDYETLLREADASGPGARGLLMLPYFAGERTPLMDPAARGLIAGLTLEHTRGDLYRAALEAVACGVRHNIEAIQEAGGDVRRLVAVGGGTRGSLWPQIVSDVTGRDQVLPTQTVGASYGGALLAAQAVTDVSITDWNPPANLLQPRPELGPDYDELYELYRSLYESSRPIAHALTARQTRMDTARNHQGPATLNEGQP